MKGADFMLKEYMLEHFDYRSLKQTGFYKDVSKNDYKEQARRVVEFFGLESIYEYHKQGYGQRVHLSWANDPNGFRPFVETIGGKMHNSDGGKVIEFKKQDI